MAGSSAFKDFQERRYFDSLDGVRCLSILAVLWHHSPLFQPGQETLMLLNRGFLGVDLFFVLSGFLITTLLLREEARVGRFSITGFYRRRILRIFPTYFLLVTLLSIYYIGVKGRADLAALVPYYYFFLANFLMQDIPLLAPTWSLSVEEQYYLIWPLILLLTLHARRVRGWFLGAALVFFAAAQQWGIWPGPVETKHAIWAWPGGAYGAILLGSLLAVILQTERGFCAVWRLFDRRWMPAVLLVGLLALLEMLPGDLTGWPELSVHLGMAAFLASVVIQENHVLRPILTARPVVRIGAISYGIYLYHLIGLDIATRLAARAGLNPDTTPGAIWITVGLVLISLLIAEISFRTYERFFLSLK